MTKNERMILGLEQECSKRDKDVCLSDIFMYLKKIYYPIISAILSVIQSH